jgi:thioredoxin-related protein
VNGIERELGERAQLLQLNVMGGVGRELAVRYQVRGVPTFVLLDGEGEVVLRQVGTPQREEIITAVEQLR